MSDSSELEPIRLLLVDDQPDNLIFLEAALARKDRIMTMAYSGPQALTLVGEQRFDIVIMDVTMPGMDGFETASHIRELNGHAPAIIFITAMGPDEDKMLRGYEVGATDYLVKPINLELLRSKVDAYVTHARHKKHLVRRAQDRDHLEKQVKARTEELQSTNRRLKLLLETIKEMSSAHDIFSVMVQASNFLVRELSLSKSADVHIFFREEESDGTIGYAQFRMKTHADQEREPLIKLHGLRDFTHSYSTDPPLSLEEVMGGGHLDDGILRVPIRHDAELLGLIEIASSDVISFEAKEKEFVDTVCQFLAIAIENINSTLVLERKVQQRTKGLKNSLTIQETISNNLLATSKELNHTQKKLETQNEELSRTQKELQGQNQELNQAKHDLEQQNTELLGSNRKLEELNSTKEQLLEKLSTLHDTHISALKEIHDHLLKEIAPERKDILREAIREVEEIDEMLHPITSLYHSEQAIQSKRVLLAEREKKQQILAKMALGGTGVELDIVSKFEDGKALLEQNRYDVLCVDVGLIELAQIAHERSPNTKSVFMTSEDVPMYLPILMELPFLSNIVSRNDEDRTFTLKNILITVSKLVNQDLFGLEKYLSWGVEVKHLDVTSSGTRDDLTQEMIQYFQHLGVRRNFLKRIEMVVEELLMNAIYDAPTDASGKALYNHLPRTVPVNLKPDEQGLLRYASDGVLLAVSVEDPFGAFDRQTILDYLHSCYSGLAGTLNEEQQKGGAGRGLFQIIETAELVVINVKPGIKTEVIAIFNLDAPKTASEKTTSFHYFFG